jgi:GT2 family glycosyltransferase/lipopolysaccharide/colanic/teichoic acid biosynthesis glycosyltransferase
MDLSVIIVNYNVRQFLENALTSIRRAMEGLEGEVFVVDNASEDGSIEMVRSKFPDVILIENRINLGFARANNLALKQARGRCILLVNPDTVVQENTLRVMLRFFDENPDVGLAGCKILNPDGSFQLPCRRSFPTPWVAFTKIFGFSALFPKSRLFGRYNLTYLNTDETYEVEAVSGSFMMVRREAYLRVGGLDESFFMYGEDLDWCYRFSQAGHKVFYVHSTAIIHFKGESTRRSDLDEIRVFYNAMQLFVEKHFNSSVLVEALLNIGISLRAGIAFAAKAGRTLGVALVDMLLVAAGLLLAEYIYFGHIFRFPAYAYPVVFIVPGAIVTIAMYMYGVYTTHKFSGSRTAVALIGGYVVISALVFFAKDFAFSRAVVLISGFMNLLALPGWRLILVFFGKSAAQRGRRSLFGRRTVIVGTGVSGQEVLRKLRTRVDDGYEVLGFIGTSRRQVGERVAGLEVLGSLDNVGKVIDERKVSEVIFSTDGMAYTDILSIVGRNSSRNVNYRLVPNSLEAIIGKTRIDELDNLPLVEIEYNIRKPMNKTVKRMFDLLCGIFFTVTVFPFVRVWQLIRPGPQGRVTMRILLLPLVVTGKLSMVGRPLGDTNGRQEESALQGSVASYLGPRGLTGLVQINRRDGLETDEIEKYKLYYAKNQSLILDLEIILKSFLLLLKT